MKSIYFFVFLPCFLLACKVQENSQTESKLLFSLQRTICLGTCPVYNLEIYENGSMKLVGEKYFDYIGSYTSKISPEEIDRLKALFLKEDFFAFKDRYVTNVTDLPTTYIYFADQEQEKKIMDYAGTPKAIRRLEDALDEVIKNAAWTKLADSKKE